MNDIGVKINTRDGGFDVGTLLKEIKDNPHIVSVTERFGDFSFYSFFYFFLKNFGLFENYQYFCSK